MTERIKALREEIASISKENSNLPRGRKDALRRAEQQRRLQRLQEIKDELLSLTAWKKL